MTGAGVVWTTEVKKSTAICGKGWKGATVGRCLSFVVSADARKSRQRRKLAQGSFTRLLKKTRGWKYPAWGLGSVRLRTVIGRLSDPKPSSPWRGLPKARRDPRRSIGRLQRVTDTDSCLESSSIEVFDKMLLLLSLSSSRCCSSLCSLVNSMRRRAVI